MCVSEGSAGSECSSPSCGRGRGRSSGHVRGWKCICSLQDWFGRGGEAGQGCAGCSEAQITCASEKVPAITSAAELD